MRIRQETNLGCGNNKARYAGNARYCDKNGLDFSIYRLGPDRIKKMIQRRYGISLTIADKSRDQITREAMKIVYQ